MKKYRLKKWYPSLPNGIEAGHIIEYDVKSVNSNGDEVELYLLRKGAKKEIWITSRELHPDFWELIEEEKPLFVTEDGVEVFLNNVELFAVNEIFETASAINFDFDCCKKEGWKLFFHKANADEYIWRSKPQFSYEDIIRYLIHSVCDIEQLNHLVQGFRKLAKERSKQ